MRRVRLGEWMELDATEHGLPLFQECDEPGFCDQLPWGLRTQTRRVMIRTR